MLSNLLISDGAFTCEIDKILRDHGTTSLFLIYRLIRRAEKSVVSEFSQYYGVVLACVMQYPISIISGRGFQSGLRYAVAILFWLTCTIQNTVIVDVLELYKICF